MISCMPDVLLQLRISSSMLCSDSMTSSLTGGLTYLARHSSPLNSEIACPLDLELLGPRRSHLRWLRLIAIPARLSASESLRHVTEAAARHSPSLSEVPSAASGGLASS